MEPAVSAIPQESKTRSAIIVTLSEPVNKGVSVETVPIHVRLHHRLSELLSQIILRFLLRDQSVSWNFGG